MQQQKRPNTALGREIKEMKMPVRKHNKVKQIKSKIFKNISQLPIDIYLDSKENHVHNHPNRPQSSLVQQTHHLKNFRIQSALSQYPENKEGNNRKRLSLDSTGKKYQRDSLISKNSLNKKMSRNNKSIEDSLKLKYAQERRKSNVSCRSILQGKIAKKQSLKIKRPSVSSLHQGFIKDKQKDKENKQPKQPYKLADKSRSKSKKIKRKSTVQLDKSKASTAVIINMDKGNIKKKQSTSTAYIGAIMLPKKKKKVNKKKQEKAMDLSNAIEQPSIQEYPISKYDVWTKPSKPTEARKISSKRRSRSGKGSASKQRKKGSSSMFQIDYVSCINIPSNSSGLIESKQSNNSSQRNSKIKILDNWEYHYLGEQNTQSVNLQQIRYYQSYHYSHKKQEKDFIEKNFKDKSKYYFRHFIQEEIAEEYPHFQQVQLKFLASVIFIQRKWRQNKLYRQIFEQIAHSPHKISHMMSIQKTNSAQLNISYNYKSSQKQYVQEQEKKLQSKENISMECKDQQIFSQIQKEKENEQQLRNKIYLFQQFSQSEDQKESIPSRMRQQAREEVKQQMNSDENNLTTRSEKYDFLGNQLFPSMSYLRVKQQQLKQELYQKICQFNQLERSGTIDGREYQKLKSICQEKYKRELNDLSKSRKEIKKGYLCFIETCNKIKQTNGLRRVSSDHGPMALLYKRIFNLQSQQHTPSQSSQSLKKLTKRVLIRREFFQSQKIEPNILHATLQSTLSARQYNRKQQESSLSARIFQRNQFQIEVNQKNQTQELQIKRIREGFILSPDIRRKEFQHSLMLQKGQKQENTSGLKEQLVMEEVIATLTHELFCELMKIDQRRENVVDILQEGHDSNIIRIKGSQIKDFQIVEESSSLDFQHEIDYEGFQIVEQSKLRQIYKIQGLSQKLQPDKNRKHRKSKTYNISPASLQPIKFEEQEIITYGKQLFSFLKSLKIEEDLIEKLNKNQGFSPEQYLRFLRDFQIPDQEYQPLISNQVFMQWEDQYDNKHLQNQQDQGYVKRQASAVFHRCIFECLIGFLQDFRPCGEKGEPFPWQKVMHFKRVLTNTNIEMLFRQSLAKLEHTIKLKCGIIEEKQVIFSQSDMQRVHEQNQDKIIFMLEQELSQSLHNWYQVQQHCLQVKLEIETQLFDYIMLQALDQLLQLF